MSSRTSGDVGVLVRRHALVAMLGMFWLGMFWLSRPTWVAEMRLWKSAGDAGLMLLLLTLAAGPLAVIWKPARALLPWRRETGIWFAIFTSLHAVLIIHGWARWSVSRFFGYEFVPQLGRDARMEPGFGLANLVGLVALFWALVLAGTSSDRSLRKLGQPAWKWLHNAAHVIFYLTVVHVSYFLFMHFTLSFHKQPPAPDWFRLPFVVLASGVIVLQMAGFRHRLRDSARRSAGGKKVKAGSASPA